MYSNSEYPLDDARHRKRITEQKKSELESRKYITNSSGQKLLLRINNRRECLDNDEIK
nr:15599_t:CDS:2 [Entrophospora candida]